MSQAFIETSNLCRYYRRGQHEVKAVDGVDIAIEHGAFVSLVGASGSGKSTILNLLAGLDRPTNGRVRVGDSFLDEMSRKQLSAYRAAQVGMVFQSFNLLPHRTALANVELALLFDSLPRSQRRQAAQEALEQLGLGERLDHKPADLSGGEQQRVAVARALVKKPTILFADEPTGNLDHENSETIATLLKELHTAGMTVVMVTHDHDLANKLSTQQFHLSYGKLLEEDRK